MFLAVELQTPGVYVSPYGQDLFDPSEKMIRIRKIALHDEHFLF